MQYHITVTWNTHAMKSRGLENEPQIRSILDDKGQDVTHLIDSNKSYPNLQSIQSEIAQKLGMEKDEVVVTEAE